MSGTASWALPRVAGWRAACADASIAPLCCRARGSPRWCRFWRGSHGVLASPASSAWCCSTSVASSAKRGSTRASSGLCHSAPATRPRCDPENQALLLKELALGARPAIAMMPGAEYGPAKQWPLVYFRTLAKALVEHGFEVWVLGGPGDRADGETIAQGLARVYNLCGRTRLADTVDLLAACCQAVTNDSGLMHVAAAAGTRVQAIYGSSSPAYTPPLTSRAE